MESDRMLMNEKRKTPLEKQRISQQQKDYYLKNREKKIALRHIRYNTRKNAKLNTCILCGNKSKLQCHHINYFHSDAYLILCSKCHRKMHRRYDYNALKFFEGGVNAMLDM
jgi:hypothetical protein